jgi:hypothetical protein
MSLPLLALLLCQEWLYKESDSQVLPVGHQARVLGSSTRGSTTVGTLILLGGQEQNIMYNTGTPAQGRLLYNLAFKANKLAPGTTRESLIAKVQAMTQREVKAQIDRMNALVGFDRDTSPATVRQGQYISDLLRKLYRSQEDWDLPTLTYQDANAWIKELKAELVEQAAQEREQEEQQSGTVIDMFTRRTVNGFDDFI